MASEVGVRSTEMSTVQPDKYKNNMKTVTELTQLKTCGHVTFKLHTYNGYLHCIDQGWLITQHNVEYTLS